MLILIGVTLVVCLAVAYVLHKDNYFRKLYLTRNIPGPKTIPILGNALMFVNKTAEDNFAILSKAIVDYGDVCAIWIGPDLNVFLTNPLDVDVLLSSSQFINKSGEYKYIKPWLSEGLLLSEGKKWHQRRKILTPAFHFKILEEYVEIFDRQSDVMIETLSGVASDDPIDILSVATLCALDVIGETAMGTSLNAQLKSDSEYVLAVKEMTHVIHLRMFDMLLRVDLLFRFSQLYRTMINALKILHNFTDSVILDRREQLLREPASSTTAGIPDVSDVGAKKKIAFLDILLQAKCEGKPLTNLDIREEVDTFMFEGHDTTTSAIIFTIYSIAKHPQVQKKCVEEIKKLLGEDMKKRVTLQDLHEMSYLELVIKEALRMYPSVPLIGRHITKETTINGTILPEGTNVIVPIYSMGRDPNLFVDPNEFRPERFLETHVSQTKNAFAYIPFSAGPRNCIGQKFAMLELKSIISKILRNFEVRLAEDSVKEPKMKAELILVPETINVHLTKRSILGM